MQVTVCGGGNAAHVLAGLLSARRDCEVSVYAPYDDEAERWRKGVAARGGIAVVTSGDTVVGRPCRISADPAEVVPGSRLVLLAVPAFAHELTLRQISPHLDTEAWVGAFPARGGFDWCVEDVLWGNPEAWRISKEHPLRHVGASVVFGLQTLPWACRIRVYGQEAEILGTKAQVDLATWPQCKAGEVATLLGELLGVSFQPVADFMALTLANMGQIIHPGVMYGLFHDWDGRLYSDAPLFYQGINAATAGVLQQLSDEVQALRADLEHRYPGLDLSAVRPLDEWLRRAYAGSITDVSSLESCFRTNRSYAGLRAPMQAVNGGLMPDFHARYLAEDVPYGLIVTRGIAELAGVPTPFMDQVILWAQERLEKEYLVEGKLQGQDVATSRAPQRYGFQQLDELIPLNGAVVASQ